MFVYQAEVETLDGYLKDLRQGDVLTFASRVVLPNCFITKIEPQGHRYRGRVRARRVHTHLIHARRIDRTQALKEFDTEIQSLYDQIYGYATQMPYEEDDVVFYGQIHYDDYQDLNPTNLGNDHITRGHIVIENPYDDDDELPGLWFVYFESRQSSGSN